MPPRAIKHQLTCPIELTSGSFLIGRRGILVIPRNRQESPGIAWKMLHSSKGHSMITQKMADEEGSECFVAFAMILCVGRL